MFIPTEPPNEQFDPIFKRMDIVFNTVRDSMPIASNELMYRMELETAVKLYALISMFGLLLIVAILLSSWTF